MGSGAAIRLALTPGEPAGIGPDLCVRIAQQDWASELIAVADPDLLAMRAERLGIALELTTWDPSAGPPRTEPVP